jgi:hypothetical protein
VLGRVAKAWGYIAASSATGARAATDAAPVAPEPDGAATLDAATPAGQAEAPTGGDGAVAAAGGVLVPPIIPDRGIVLAGEPADIASAPPALASTGPLAPAGPLAVSTAVLDTGTPMERLDPNELLDAASSPAGDGDAAALSPTRLLDALDLLRAGGLSAPGAPAGSAFGHEPALWGLVLQPEDLYG